MAHDSGAVFGLALPVEGVGVRRPRAAVTPLTEQEFHLFYTATARPLRAYLRRCVGDPTLADDLLQESFLRLLRSGFATDDEVYRRNYLYRIATNLVRDHYRQRRPMLALEDDRLPTAGAGDAVERRADVGRAFARLGERDRLLLWLAHVEGSDHREIAHCMGLQPASVRSMLHRARQRLAGLLRQVGFAPAGEAP
jgi:RNA polymerase sigma-70 factor (ECF subfamily)